MALYARLALEAAEFEFDKPYEYCIPDGLSLLPGMRVLVPFGKGNRKTCAMVLETTDSPIADQHKYIIEALDDEPIVDESLIRLALWMHKTVFCSVWQALRAMLPAGLRHANREFLSLVPETEGAAQPEPDSEAGRLLRELRRIDAPVDRRRLALLLEGGDPEAAADKLVTLGLCSWDTVARRRSSDKTDMLVELAISDEEAAESLAALRGTKQKEMLKALLEHGALTLSELRYLTGAATASFQKLVELGLVTLTVQEIYHRADIPAAHAAEPFELTDGQQAALDTLTALQAKREPVCALLHGVTGSGKTNVYIALMRHTIAQGGTCLILAPEIALTPQLLDRFTAHFGERVAILHSALGMRERADEWRRIRAGLADVVIGTRSAVFAPLQNLQLMILDEEHERTYKSESKPRYHAREAAKFRAVQNRALLVLGSATPSIESMYAASSGQYTYIELPDRFQGRPLPQVTIADMSRELKQGNAGVISGQLYEELKQNLLAGEQTILLLNRRGASKHIICPGCGTVPECPRCSRRLVYHSASGRLHCHLCGHSEKKPEACRDCGDELQTVGVGTQKLESELQELFPNTEMLRLDADTTLRKGALQKILSDFANRRVPILIGTQMVAKGLDFPHVTLVGVVNADEGLWAPDFRAFERTFSLLTQVVGRGGRGETPGRAVLQSYTGAQPTLLDAATQDYNAFYEREIQLRQILGLPPFTFITRLCFFGMQQDAVLKACLRVRGWIERWLAEHPGSGLRVLGPAQAANPRVNLRYRYLLTVIAQKREQPRELTAAVLRAFPKDRQNKGVQLYADPDAFDN